MTCLFCKKKKKKHNNNKKKTTKNITIKQPSKQTQKQITTLLFILGLNEYWFIAEMEGSDCVSLFSLPLFVLCKRLIERQEGSDLKKERNVWHNADDSFSGTPPGTEVEGLKPKNQKLLSQTWGFYYWILNSLQAFYNFWCL